MQVGQTIVQTREELMRGYDYSTALASGIALLVAKNLSSERALMQAFGRVGRYGQACRRFVLEGKGVSVYKEAKIREPLRRGQDFGKSK